MQFRGRGPSVLQKEFRLLQRAIVRVEPPPAGNRAVGNGAVDGLQMGEEAVAI